MWQYHPVLLLFLLGVLLSLGVASGFSDALEGGSGEEKRKEVFEEVPGARASRQPASLGEMQYCPHCGSELPHVSSGERANGEAEAQVQAETAASSK